MNTFGKIVKAAREGKKLDRNQAAKKLGISPGYLGHIEREGTAPVPVSEALATKIKRVFPQVAKTKHAEFLEKVNARAAKYAAQRAKRRKAEAPKKKTKSVARKAA